MPYALTRLSLGKSDVVVGVCEWVCDWVTNTPLFVGASPSTQCLPVKTPLGQKNLLPDHDFQTRKSLTLKLISPLLL